eukprot:COSAG03_NODE_6113_length_1114_cov_4.002956_2_plen_91_part_00
MQDLEQMQHSTVTAPTHADGSALYGADDCADGEGEEGGETDRQTESHLTPLSLRAIAALLSRGVFSTQGAMTYGLEAGRERHTQRQRDGV